MTACGQSLGEHIGRSEEPRRVFLFFFCKAFFSFFGNARPLKFGYRSEKVTVLPNTFPYPALCGGLGALCLVPCALCIIQSAIRLTNVLAIIAKLKLIQKRANNVVTVILQSSCLTTRAHLRYL